jgi:Transposase DDE domain group 1
MRPRQRTDQNCYLPLYVFCGRHLLAARLRRSNIDASAGAKEEVGRIISAAAGRGCGFCSALTVPLPARS